jgi:hypothetical protein
VKIEDSPPGLFLFLIRDGVMNAEALRPLLAVLPPERFVQTAVRNGEGFDSTRWPLARDAALARHAARRWPDPHVPGVLDEIAAVSDAREALSELRGRTQARMYAAGGVDVAVFARVWRREVTDAERQIFQEPAWSADDAQRAADLVESHWQAADGLYAYHVHRGLPGPSAEPAARVVASTLGAGLLTISAVVEAAIALTQPGT